MTGKDSGASQRGKLTGTTQVPSSVTIGEPGKDLGGNRVARAEAGNRWHTQTIVGGGDVPPEERGDCVRACITSILGLPIDAIENVHGDKWWERLNAEVAKHGYTLALLWLAGGAPDAYWIATVPSLTLGDDPDGQGALHTVVAKGYELVHDPGMKRRYTRQEWAQAFNDNHVSEGWALVPLDPALGAGSG